MDTITINIDPKTLKGIIIGAVGMAVVLITVYQIAVGISRNRYRDFPDDYGGDSSRRRAIRRNRIGLFLIIGIASLLSLWLMFNKFHLSEALTKQENVKTSQTVVSTAQEEMPN